MCQVLAERSDSSGGFTALALRLHPSLPVDPKELEFIVTLVLDGEKVSPILIAF
jgi:hypothetical protein